jgi:hypothetical protein
VLNKKVEVDRKIVRGTGTGRVIEEEFRILVRGDDKDRGTERNGKEVKEDEETEKQVRTIAV